MYVRMNDRMNEHMDRFKRLEGPCAPVSASGDVNGSGTSENESSDPGDPVL